MDNNELDQLKIQILVFLYLKLKTLQAAYKDFFNIKTLGSEENLLQAIESLKTEKLLAGDTIENISLTIPGRYEVEVKYFNPAYSTSINIVQISQMVNSAIQQGSPHGNISMSIEDANQIKQFIAKVDNHLDIEVINTALLNHQANAENLIKRYHDSLIEELKSFEIIDFGNVSHTDKHWGDFIEESLIRMIIVRDKFLELYFGIIDNSLLPIEKILHELLGRLIQFNFNTYEYFDQRNTLTYLRADNYRIFIYEVFLHTSTYLLKNERFNDLSFVLHYPYQVHLVDRNRNIDKYASCNFSKFNISSSLFNDERRRYEKGVYFGNRDLLVEFILSRCESTKNSLIKLKETDVLLYYISLFSPDNRDPIYWLPYLSKAGIKTVETMQRSVSRNYFDKMKTIFNVASDDEFVKKLNLIPGIQRQHEHIIHNHNIREYEFILNTQFLCKEA